jgi:myo-inositol 2-dehydrogenase / D-chiro-inositol 1-dehydrogenase
MKTPLSSPVGNRSSRRAFLKKSSAALSAVAVSSLDISRFAHAAGSDELRLSLIGCGGRGTGAAANALNNAVHPNIKLVAMADAFSENLNRSYQTLQNQFKGQVAVPGDQRFVGLDAYKQAIECEADIVLLCTPPGFRPAQFEAAVKAGKHVFMEKPVAVDAPGYRRVRAANELAKEKGLRVAVGHHLRHSPNHRQVIEQIHNGLLGDLLYTRAFFNVNGIWNRLRQPGMTEMQYQVHNWYHFTWLSGDHIVEQHVHGIDICNWFAREHPVEAIGMGGRQVRIAPGIGEIFDHHSVEYVYPSGARSFSECRQMPGCWSSFSHHAFGPKGSASFEGNDAVTIQLKGKSPERVRGGANGHQLEWDHLLAALVSGQEHNEGGWGAESTLTAVLGRMATYSGKLVNWDEAVNSELSDHPDELAWDAEPKSKPGPDGVYPCAIPGVTEAV